MAHPEFSGPEPSPAELSKAERLAQLEAEKLDLIDQKNAHLEIWERKHRELGDGLESSLSITQIDTRLELIEMEIALLSLEAEPELNHDS